MQVTIHSGTSYLRILWTMFTVVLLVLAGACSNSLEKSLYTHASYKRVYFSALDSVLEAGFGVLEADMGEGLIRAEQNVAGQGEESKFFIKVLLKDNSTQVDIDFEVTGPSFSASEREKALEKFKKGLRERLHGSGGNI